MSAAFRAQQRSRLEAWAASLDPTVRGEIDWTRSWLGLTVVLVALVAVVAWAPGLRDFFRLRPAVPLTALALAQTVLPLSILLERGGYQPLMLALASLTATFCFQLFASSLVIQSEPPGAFALAVLPVLAAGFAGLILRAGTRFPWVAITEAVAIAAALALRPGAPHLGLFLVIGPLAVGSCVVLGVQVERVDRERRRAEQQRSAIQAQVLEERASDVRRLASTLAEIAERSREASAALAVSARAGEELSAASGPESAESSEQLAESLRSSLERVRQALAAARQVGSEPALRGEALASAPVAPVLRSVVEQARRRFPRIAIATGGSALDGESAAAVLRGGAESLWMVLDHLVTNACEGDGSCAARRVEVTVEGHARLGAVAVRVSDDGPGFPAALLARPIEPFSSTKPHGTGLGLYTAERLVRASGGSLRRENLADRGAAVTVFLGQVRSGERPAGLGAPALAELDTASGAGTGAEASAVVLDVIERFHAAIRTLDTGALRPLLHRDYRLEENGKLALEGVEAALERVEGMGKAFPDLRMEVHERLVQGNRVKESWTLQGTQVDAFLGIPASQGMLQVSGVTWVTIREGRIAMVSHWWDAAAVLHQLDPAPW
jgi:steroid delta-isomerase-like uncharacterized protein